MPDKPGYDSILCLGTVDWWYHNRGHFDLQMLRRLCRNVPVLYVNSIGMRLPKPGGGNFCGKVIRKLRSFCRGLTRVEDNFWVFSPLSLPGMSSGLPASQSFLLWQIRLAMRRAGLRNPLYWVGPPTAYPLLERLPAGPVLYQCTDRYEFYPGVDRTLIRELDCRLRMRADITVFCASFLYQLWEKSTRNPALIEHGVDYALFCAGEQMPEPEDIKDIEHPRIGFIGSMNDGVFDPDFFLEVAAMAPEMNFVVVGEDALPGRECALANVHFLGKKPLAAVPACMAACDALTMYWCRNDWIEACNPIKTKEYLAVGRPVVSTPFHELKNYAGLIKTAQTPQEFVECLRSVREWAPEPVVLRQRVAGITWDAQAQRLQHAIANALCSRL